MVAASEKGQKRSIEEGVHYAIGKRIRTEILGILNEGARSPVELADLLHVRLSLITHHIDELHKSGSIEVAKEEKVRNVNQRFYRAIKLPEVTDEEAADLPLEVRQSYAAVILQAIMAESLSSLWAGKLSEDPSSVRMFWRWFHLDAQGRQELMDELHESWCRIQEIEARAIDRCTKTGEETTSMIAAILGFERGRPVGTTAPAAHRFMPGKK